MHVVNSALSDVLDTCFNQTLPQSFLISFKHTLAETWTEFNLQLPRVKQFLDWKY